MERRRAWLALTWTVVGLAAVTAQARAQPGDRVAPLARPFPLTAVRLLDGPFKDAMLRDQAYLLELDHDRLLHTFRLTAGLPTTAKPLGGWEAPDVELRGHTAGHYLSAVALMYAATGDARFKQRGDARGRGAGEDPAGAHREGLQPGLPVRVPGRAHRPRRSARSACGRRTTRCTRSWLACSTSTSSAAIAQALDVLRASRRTGSSRRWTADRRAAAGHAGDRVRRHERRAGQPLRGDRRSRAPAAGAALRSSRRVRPAGAPRATRSTACTRTRRFRRSSAPRASTS